MKTHRASAPKSRVDLNAETGRIQNENGGLFATLKATKPTPLRVAVFMAAGFVGSVAFDASSVSQAAAKSPERRTQAASRAIPAVAGDEHDIEAAAKRLLRKTREISDIINTMPGPGLTHAALPRADQARYTNPYDEMLGRLKHATMLAAETASILESMPTPVTKTSSAPAGMPVTAPIPQPESTAPLATSPSATTAIPAPISSEPASATAAEAQAEPGAGSSTADSGRKPPLTAMTFTRLAILLIGALLALALVRCLPRMFRNGNGKRESPSLQPSPEPLEVPPLQDPALELADIMASMGLTDGAAHALVERIRTNPRQALSHWLKLLDVYRQAGKKAEFENAAEQVRSTFNVRPDEWVAPEAVGGNTPPASLENYPHIVAQMKKLWPRPECGDFLLGLLADNREGKREGFPVSVVEEIVLLLAVLRSEEAAAREEEAVPA